ncbi:methyltransferase domain-containing protein [Enterobacter asburiae]
MRQQKSALDVGCGTGQLTRLLSIYFERVIGVDPSEDQLSEVHLIFQILLSSFDPAHQSIKP